MACEDRVTHEERHQAQETLGRIHTELIAIGQETHEALQTFVQGVAERQERQQELTQQMLRIVADMQADIARMDAD